MILGAIGVSVLMLLFPIFIKFCRKPQNCQEKNEDDIEILEMYCKKNSRKYENIFDKSQEQRHPDNSTAMDEMIIRLLTVVYHLDDDDEARIDLLSRSMMKNAHITSKIRQKVEISRKENCIP